MTYELIMVTDFRGHWHDGQTTSYFSSMFYNVDEKTSQQEKKFQSAPTIEDLRPFNNAPTTFIKIASQFNQKADEAWSGSVSGFRVDKIDKGKFLFEVHIDKKKPLDELEKEIWSSGCYIYEVGEQAATEGETFRYFKYSDTTKVQQPVILSASELRPPFFDLFPKCSWQDFETYTYYLIRLLGIHQAGKFPSEAQAGKADGFFRIRGLIVMWDATIKTDFKDWKSEQIRNFCSKLFHENLLDLPKIETVDFSQYDKQVWIVIRSEQSYSINTIDGFLVKKVSVRDLIEIYEARLRDGFDERNLATKLSNIGS